MGSDPFFATNWEVPLDKVALGLYNFVRGFNKTYGKGPRSRVTHKQKNGTLDVINVC